MRIFLPLLFTLLISGCGRKGPLIPPEALVPAAVDSLSVQQKGEDIQILWRAPGKEKSGRPLKDLAGFLLQKRDIRGDGSDCAACGESWQLLKRVDLAAPDAGSGSGGVFIYRDRTAPGAASQYRLTAYSRSGGVSAPATSKVIRMHPSLPPPVLKLSLLHASVGAAVTFLPPQGGTLKGFNIYRRTPGAPMPATAYSAAPLSGIWEDMQVRFGSSYSYAATALVEIDGEIVETHPSAEAEIVFSLQELH